MGTRMNVVVAGYSNFSWNLIDQLTGQYSGRLYFVLPEREKAMEAGLDERIIAIHGDMTDPSILTQLHLDDCHTFVAGSRAEEANILSALFARENGVAHVYARIFDGRLRAMLESMRIIPILTSQTAAMQTAIEILRPAVADLVSISRGTFDMIEIQASDFPDLIGCAQGELQGEQLNIIAVVNQGEIDLSHHTLVQRDSNLIVIFRSEIRSDMKRELKRVAKNAARKNNA